MHRLAPRDLLEAQVLVTSSRKSSVLLRMGQGLPGHSELKSGPHRSPGKATLGPEDSLGDFC